MPQRDVSAYCIMYGYNRDKAIVLTDFWADFQVFTDQIVKVEGTRNNTSTWQSFGHNEYKLQAKPNVIKKTPKKL